MTKCPDCEYNKACADMWRRELYKHIGYVLPVPDPVAWMHTSATGEVYFRKNPQDKVFNPQPVYTSPSYREWQGLTDEEFMELMESSDVRANILSRVQDILRERNT